MAFFGFLRSGELVVPSDTSYDGSVHLSYSDVLVDSTLSPSYVQVNIKDPKQIRSVKGFPYIWAIQRQILVQCQRSLLIGRGRNRGPVFTYVNGKPLTRRRLVASLRTALHTAGFEASRYAGHSFRIVAATTAAAQGLPESLINTLGRWESSAYIVYIRMLYCIPYHNLVLGVGGGCLTSPLLGMRTCCPSPPSSLSTGNWGRGKSGVARPPFGHGPQH